MIWPWQLPTFFKISFQTSFSFSNYTELFGLEWIKKMWHIYTMEYHSAIKRNEIGSFVETWMDLESRVK